MDIEQRKGHVSTIGEVLRQFPEAKEPYKRAMGRVAELKGSEGQVVARILQRGLCFSAPGDNIRFLSVSSRENPAPLDNPPLKIS